ncbi:hypothetical protein [Jiella marina]|uniref:hypothetical protein n=1 Tax=Jiella sp. LLJ827 TaxID=2917712 RepID=UPI0021013B4B|nr:hypothetical protein [Jiella sp. LLJ827]MCQ0986406.1 hypothetical protein [Jiella sp. LLJ827]
MSFSKALAAADLACAAAMDETAFEAVKMRRAAGAARSAALEADPDVDRLSFMGTIDFEPSTTSFASSSRTAPDDRAPRRVTSALVTALATGWAWRPQARDRLVRVSDGAMFGIVAVDDDETGRVAFLVNRLGVDG